MIRNKLKEMTGTGSGAAFSPGAGEQNNGPASFVGGKRKKKLKETVSFTPEKRESIINDAEGKLKENESTFKRYANLVVSFSFMDLLENRGKVDKAIQTGELLKSKFTKISEQCYDIAESYEDEGGHSDPNYKKADELSTKYDELSMWSDKIKELVDAVELNLKQINNDKDLINLLK